MKVKHMDASMTAESFGPPPGFIRHRARNFSLSMIVMGASFALYYLGLFGTQEGPLNPSRIGTGLHGWGVRPHHIVLLLACCFAMSLTWDWLFNFFARISGRRFTCGAPGGNGDLSCGKQAIRLQRISKRTGRPVVEYLCAEGHRRPAADFHPVRKGIVANTIWIGWLILTLITLGSV